MRRSRPACAPWAGQARPWGRRRTIEGAMALPSGATAMKDLIVRFELKGVWS